MTTLRHFDHDGRVRFITFPCHERLPILTNNEFREIVARSIDDARARHAFRLLAYVIMPEHLHLVIWPEEESKVGTVVGWMKQEAARGIAKLLRETRSPQLDRLEVTRDRVKKLALWERRCFDHNCRDTDSIREKVQYCHNNPVKRELVPDPSRWRFSSYNWYQGALNVPLKIDALLA
jgi:putative transposase